MKIDIWGVFHDITQFPFAWGKIRKVAFSVVGQMFELDAYQEGQFLSEGFTFAAPISITIFYSDSQVVGLDEASLLLERWDEDAQEWLDAACGPYDRHPDENWLAVPFCHLSRFALIDEQYRAYLPLLNKP